MDNKNTVLKILGAVVVIVIIALAIYFLAKSPKVVINEPQQNTVIPFCFYYQKSTDRGLKDVAWLKFDVSGSKVAGEARNLPAEKDSKVGTFTGTVDPLKQQSMSRTIHAMWNSMAEGMQVTEELNIEYGDGSAVLKFGEMVDRGDGVYVYKDATNLTSGPTMSQVDCDALNERLAVEQYIRAQINQIAPKKATLGGTWYVTSIDINPTNHTALVSYEDGHALVKTTFEYTLSNDGSVIMTALSDK